MLDDDITASNTAYNRKIASYKSLAEHEVQFELLPFAVESSGKIHKAGLNFLSEVCKEGSNYIKLTYDIVYNYILKRLSCTFQRTIISGMLQRIQKINGNNTSTVVHYL